MRTTRPNHRLLYLCAAALAAHIPAHGATSTRPLTLDDYYRLQSPSEVELSPDGRWVAYTLYTPMRATDRDDGDIWLVSYDGREHIQLTRSEASDHSPHFSTDGNSLAFLRDPEDGKSSEQIWSISLHGGEARQVSHFDGAISSFALAPDGKRLAFSAVASVGAAADPERPAPIVVDRLQFRADGAGIIGDERAHLYLLDLESGQVSAITTGTFNELQPTWSPDSSQLAFLTKRGADPDATNNWDIYVIPAQAGSVARQITRNPGAEGDSDSGWSNRTPQFSPDGRQLTYEAGGKAEDAWYALVQVGLANVAGDLESTPAAVLDRNCIDPRFSRDGRFIYFRLEDNRSMVLARVRLSDGRIERLSPAGHVVYEFDLGAGDHTVLIDTTPTQPPELYALESGKLRALTRHNSEWLAQVELAPAVALDFKSPDGLEIGALLLNPPGAPPPSGWPTLVRLHGGPNEQYQFEFDFDFQMFVTSGYAVLAPNTRGSNGRGIAFGKLLFGKWGLVDVPDVLAAVDYAVAQHITDPQRLGVGGWSYGGMLTDYVIASDHRFRAATSGAGTGNMLAGYGTDEHVRWWELELGLPWENTALWLELSYPFLHADRITTPTLFLGGGADSNVPLAGGEQMYQALRRLGVPTQLVIYPGEYHWLSRPSLWMDVLKRYIDWYDRFVKGSGASATVDTGSLAVHCGALIDGTADTARRDVTVVIRDGRVESLLEGGHAPHDLPLLELGDFTCLPGLIDMHTHLTDLPEDDANLKVFYTRTREEQLAISEDNAAATLAAGFTTVRNVGTYIAWTDRDLRDVINQGKALGPRMQIAGFYLSIPGGGGDMLLPGVPEADIPARVRTGVAANAEEFAVKARLAIDGGADLLKVIASGAVIAYGGVPSRPEMSAAEIAAVVAVAHAAGRKVAAHAHAAQSIKDAILAGVDTIEHASYMDDEGIALARAHGTALSMDIYDGDYIDSEGRRQHWPAEFLRKNIEITEVQRQGFTRALAAGVPIVFGTDAGVYPHGQNARQFPIMVAHGMTPMQAIKSATSVAAHYMGWDDRVGRLMPGLYGDLIAVRGDPLQDIAHLQQVAVVIKGGIPCKLPAGM